jgi:hypothetical protein
MNAIDRPGARFISWVAEDEARIESVLAFGKEHDYPGSLARWDEGQLRACHAHLRGLRSPAPAPAPPAPEVVPAPESAPDLASFGIRSGRDFFFWLRDRSHEHGIALVDWMTDWAGQRGYDRIFARWDLVQVARGLEVATAKLAEVTGPAAPAPVPAVAAVTTTPVDASPDPDRIDGQTTLEFLRAKLYEQALAIARLQYPGRKLAGKDLAQVCAGLSELDERKRRLTTIRGCVDYQVLIDFNVIAELQLNRLRANQTAELPLAEVPAAEPTLFGPAEEAACDT